MARQEIHAGYGSHAELGPVLRALAPRRVFLVTAGESFTTCGAESLLGPLLAPFDPVRFPVAGPTVVLETVRAGIALFARYGCDAVVGVGGGTAMDTAKAVALLATQTGDLAHFVRAERAPQARGIPSIAIPTTAGTGSESTHFAAVYLGESKHSLAAPSMLPDHALLDPTFTLDLPPYVTACTGMDALCQGIESFWSVRSTEASRTWSERAVRGVLAHLPGVVRAPTRDGREAMLQASNQAGRAIDVARTTIAHAVSYHLTAVHGIPHGHAVALTLPSFFELNAATSSEDVRDPRGPEFVAERMAELCAILGVADGGAAKQRLFELMDEIGLERRLTGLGVRAEDLVDVVAKGFNPERARNNPRAIDSSDLRALLQEVL